MGAVEREALSPEPIAPKQLGIGALFDQIRDAVVVGEARSGQIVLWNTAAEHLLGYTRAEAMGLRIESLVPAELVAQHRHGIERYAKSRKGTLIDSGTLIELPAVHKDGHRVFVEFSLTPLTTDAVSGRFVMAILRDVTERRRAEQQMKDAHKALSLALEAERAAVAELTRLDEARSEFVAIAAHDVRGPMTNVLGFVRVLAEYGDDLDRDQRDEALAAIERAAERVVRLTEDVLQVAALEARAVPVDARAVPVGGALEAVVAQLQMNGSQRISVDVSDGLAVLADPERLWQVLTNLVNNAVRYSGGSAVELTAHGIDPGEVEIVVRDHGAGVDLSGRDTLFEPFRRLRPDVAAGMGLGLYLTRQLVELMGGRIRYEDPPDGPGAMFVVTLPRD